jgi:hypothetical protein
MTSNDILVNDTVRIKVKFVDIDPVTGDQIEVSPDTVNVLITNSDSDIIINEIAVDVDGSTWYYDFNPTVADTYNVKFTGTLSLANDIVVEQKLYVSSLSEEYKPTVVLGAEETIVFSGQLDPLYLDPESLLSYFPDASLLEIAEIAHNFSLEIKGIYKLADTEDGSGLSFNVIEYLKAATACELSRTYGYGGDDEMSLHLGDFTVTNKSIPRISVTRDNATSWCQIATALRKEMLATKVGPMAMQPKGLPVYPKSNSTGRTAYPSDREIYSASQKTSHDDPMPGRGLKSYD